MIVAYTGKLGMGKTYTMTQDIVKELNKGVKVYSNYRIFWNGYKEKENLLKSMLIRLGLRRPYRHFPASNVNYWSETEEILDLEDGIIAMDEGSVYLNSRNWSLLDPEFQRKLLQSRKDGLHIFFTAQRIGQIDITLRNLVNSFYISKFVNLFGFKFFLLGEYEINNAGDIDEEKRISTRFVRLNTKVKLYDTNEKISSIVSTMANYAVQAKNRAYKVSQIKKFETEINTKLAAQGYDITVEQVLAMEEKDQRQTVSTEPDTPYLTTEMEESKVARVAKKAIHRTVQKPKPARVYIPVREVQRLSAI